MVLGVRNASEKEKGNEKDPMIQEKRRRLLETEFTNHKEFLKALIAMEFESMGINHDELVNSQEMQEWIRQKKSRLLEIEAEKRKEEAEKKKEEAEKRKKKVKRLVVKLKARTTTPEEQESLLKKQAVGKLVHESPISMSDDLVRYRGEMQERVTKKRSRLHGIDSKNKKNDEELTGMGFKARKKKPEEQEACFKQDELFKKRQTTDGLVYEPFEKLLRATAQAEIESQKKNDKKRKAAAPLPAPAMPGELMDGITGLSGENVKWVIEKPLHKSDIKKDQNRLSIPVSQVNVEDYLTKEEKMQLSKDMPIPIDVLVSVDNGTHQPQLWSMNFNRWKMNSKGIYVLQTNWWKLVDHNNLREGDKVQVWSFRRSQNGEEKKKLSFAINAIRAEQQRR